jgi:hypothetical protein
VKLPASLGASQIHQTQLRLNKTEREGFLHSVAAVESLMEDCKGMDPDLKD